MVGSSMRAAPAASAGAWSDSQEHWIDQIDLRPILDRVGSPVFVYSETRLIENVRRVQDAALSAGLAERVSLYVPFFPNSNPHVLAPLRRHGVGLLLQVPQELDLVTRYGFDDFIISPGHISDAEIALWNATPYWTFLGSVDELAFAIGNSAKTLCLRIDALGSDKPGVKFAQLPLVADLLRRHDRALDCFEVYCGSGNSLEQMVDIVRQILQIHLDHFPDTRAINFAGGHGFQYDGWDPAEKHFDWRAYFGAIRDLTVSMGIAPDVRFLFEPARDVLADSGVLVAGVKRDIISHAIGHIVVTDASRMLMPSAQMRNRAHNIAFFDEQFHRVTGADRVSAMVRGRTILRNDYLLPLPYDVPTAVKAGDHLIVYDVGAYCATQHMEFLNVPPAAEVLITADGQAQLLTRRGDALDKWRNLLPTPDALAPTPVPGREIERPAMQPAVA